MIIQRLQRVGPSRKLPTGASEATPYMAISRASTMSSSRKNTPTSTTPNDAPACESSSVGTSPRIGIDHDSVEIIGIERVATIRAGRAAALPWHPETMILNRVPERS